MDKGILLLLLLLFLVPIISNFIKHKQKSKAKVNSLDSLDLNDLLPYKQTFILTKNEYRFYKTLRIIADRNNLLICPKVGLKDLFTVTDRENYMSWFGRIAQKHIDFLVCDNMLKPLFGIELDDKSHGNGQNKGDELKNALFKQSDISLIRVRAIAEYPEKYVEDVIGKSVTLNHQNDFENNKTDQEESSATCISD